MSLKLKRSFVLLKRLFFICIVSMVSSARVSADFISYTLSFNSPAHAVVPRFDPTLGTLQSIQLQANINFCPWIIAVENLNPNQGGNVCFWITGSCWLGSVYGNGIGNREYGFVGPFDGIQDGMGSDSIDIVDEGYPNIGDGFSISGSDTIYSGFEDFIGTGFMWLGYGADYNINFTCDENLSIMPYYAAKEIWGDGILTYTYNPAPETTPLLLLCMALLGFGGKLFFKRRI